ncbi:MAG: ribbon-helix-helix protein, CopG family [Candidatus Scalindua sp.]|nr:ribbon-helix-helix protein, CopG family [Candidatus Scalindua sp.]
MGRNKVAITVNQNTLDRVDQLVSQHIFSSRSRAFEEALEEKLRRLDKSRLARECARLDPAFEKSLAEEGLSREIDEWPEY